MASLSELVDYAKSKQPRNGLAEIASHFVEGASQGYDAGHAEALKKAQQNRDNPMTTTPDGKQVPLDVYIKLLDVKNKQMENDFNQNLYNTLGQQTAVKDTANRQASLADIAKTATDASGGGMAGLPPTAQNKVASIVKDPSVAGGSSEPTKKTVTLEGGKPKLTLEYGDAKRSTVEQMTAMKNWVDTNGSPESAATLAKAFPNGMEDWATKFMATAQQHKLQTDALNSQKDQLQTEKQFAKMSEALDPTKQRQGSFGVSKQVFDRAERLQSLGQTFKDGGQLRDAEIEELAIGLNAMLSGANVGAQEQVKGLIPRTAIGNVQKMKQWFMNEPQGTHQREFVDRMMGSIGREKETAANQIKRTQLSRLSPFAKLEEKDPATFHQTLQSQGIEPQDWADFKASGFKPKSAVVQPGEGAGAGGGGKIKVSNGKETLLIDPADAAAAAKDGYQSL